MFARRSFANGAHRAAASARGDQGGSPQSWPFGLNSSGGAPTYTPGA
jgi:hypothetical protein